MSSLLALLEGLWSQIGPGVLLAFALPFLVLVLAAVARESLRRVRTDR